MSAPVPNLTTDLLNSAVGRPSASLDAGAVDVVLERARELALFPLVYQLLGREGLLENAGSKQRERWIAHRVQQRVLYERVRDVCRALDPLDFVVLKGLSLGKRLYGDPAWRATGDIDVLVTLDDLDDAVQLLGSVGFAPHGGTRPEPWVNNEYKLFHAELGVVVELHWALALPRVPSPSVDALLRHKTSVTLRDELEVPVLSAEDGFLQACYHFHHHVGFLKGLFDVAGWLDAHGEQLDWGLVEEKARRLGIDGLVQWPLWSIARLIGGRVPGQSREPRWTVEQWSRFTSAATSGALASPESIPGYSALAFKTQGALKGHTMLWSMLAAQLLDRPGARFKGVWQPVFLGPSAMAKKMGKDQPDAEVWARLVGRPFELVFKQLRDLSRS